MRIPLLALCLLPLAATSFISPRSKVALPCLADTASVLKATVWGNDDGQGGFSQAGDGFQDLNSNNNDFSSSMTNNQETTGWGGNLNSNQAVSNNWSSNNLNGNINNNRDNTNSWGGNSNKVINNKWGGRNTNLNNNNWGNRSSSTNPLSNLKNLNLNLNGMGDTMSSPRQILSSIVNTPTPGLETLPLVVMVLLVPAAMVAFPVALNTLLGVLLGATVVLEATEFEVGSYLKDMVMTIASRPTPGLDEFKYVPVVYPIMLALGGICLPYPTNAAFLGLFALSWFVSNALFEFDEEIPTNLTALVAAVLSTGLLGGLVLNPVELSARVGFNGATNLLIAGLPILAVALALKPRDNEQLEELLDRPAASLREDQQTFPKSSSSVLPGPAALDDQRAQTWNSDNLGETDGWSNPGGARMGFGEQPGMMNGNRPMMDDRMGVNDISMGAFQQDQSPMVDRPGFQQDGSPMMDRPMGRNGVMGDATRMDRGDPGMGFQGDMLDGPPMMDRQMGRRGAIGDPMRLDRGDPGMGFQGESGRVNPPMRNDEGRMGPQYSRSSEGRRPANEIASNEGFLRMDGPMRDDEGRRIDRWDHSPRNNGRRRPANEIASNEGFLRDRSSAYARPNEERYRQRARNEMQANEGFLNGSGANRF